jgi:purine-binding chemotaxis protein CheW
MNVSTQLQTRPRAAAPAAAEPKEQYLAFLLGSETFAMAVRTIREVIQCEAITPVPLMPGCVRGVINLRGAVVPVLDLAVRLEREPSVIERRTCIVVLEVELPGGTLDLGILVDHVSEVLELREADIEPPPAFGPELRREFLAGMVNLGGRFVLLLDAGRLLEGEALAAIPD